MTDEYTHNEFTISTDRAKLDLDVIHDYLTHSYWSPGIERGRVVQFIPNSFCFGLYHKEQQIGFARVVTDYNTFAYLADVFVLESFRGQGLGKWIIKTIVEHPRLKGLRRWVLFTEDAHGLYSQYGFTALPNPKSCMQLLSSPPNRGN
jgi:GNAT superfamily N-acetyltransferase